MGGLFQFPWFYLPFGDLFKERIESMKVTKIWRGFNRSIKFIWNHPLVQNERLLAIFRYVKFHFRYRNGQKCIIPFVGQSLIIKKGEGS